MKVRMLCVIVLVALALVSVVPLAAQTPECEPGFRLFDHELLATNPVCIPEQPQRIIALERLSFETLMSVDHPPLATSSGYLENFVIDFPAIADRVEGIENVGTTDETPNFEALLALQPDLIFGSGPRALEFYDALSAIAPTLLYDFDHSGQWQDIAGFTVDAVSRQEAYTELMTVYNARLDILRETVSDSEPVISVVRIMPTDVRLYVRDSFSGEIIHAAGLRRPESQDYTSAEMQAAFGQQTFYTISQEQVPMADGDIIFIWTTGSTRDLAEDAAARLEALRSDPLWGALPAVQNGAIHEVGGYWIGSSYIAAHYVLDDLFRYVAGVDPAEVAPNPFVSGETEG
jgi:iron complex transport system substrate-binding protein